MLLIMLYLLAHKIPSQLLVFCLHLPDHTTEFCITVFSLKPNFTFLTTQLNYSNCYYFYMFISAKTLLTWIKHNHLLGSSPCLVVCVRPKLDFFT